MSESWAELLTRKAKEAQAPFLLPSNAVLRTEEEHLQEDKQFLSSPMKDFVIPKGFEARKEGLYFVPVNEEKPPVFISGVAKLPKGRQQHKQLNSTHSTYYF